jgi:hypothetical protein
MKWGTTYQPTYWLRYIDRSLARSHERACLRGTPDDAVEAALAEEANFLVGRIDGLLDRRLVTFEEGTRSAVSSILRGIRDLCDSIGSEDELAGEDVDDAIAKARALVDAIEQLTTPGADLSLDDVDGVVNDVRLPVAPSSGGAAGAVPFDFAKRAHEVLSADLQGHSESGDFANLFEMIADAREETPKQLVDAISQIRLISADALDTTRKALPWQQVERALESIPSLDNFKPDVASLRQHVRFRTIGDMELVAFASQPRGTGRLVLGVLLFPGESLRGRNPRMFIVAEMEQSCFLTLDALERIAGKLEPGEPARIITLPVYAASRSPRCRSSRKRNRPSS